MSEDEEKREDGAPGIERAEPAPGAEGGPDGEAAEPGPEEDHGRKGGSGGGLRVIGSALTLPWLLLYGITGVWAIGLAARAAGQGLKRVDAGYTRFVTPGELAFFGALLVTAFAVLLACGLLLLFGRRSAAAWLPLLLVAGGLTAGAVWAGVSGGIHPLMWVFLFFGLVYVTVVALAKVLQVTKAERRETIGRS